LARSARRILVVDDDADTCALIGDILRDDGFVLWSCLSGEQALDILQHEWVDLILADIKMPRITGIDLLQHVRQRELQTRVILMTAYASLDTAIQALRGEAFDYLIKPFSLRELRQRVHEALSDEGGIQRDLHYRDLHIALRARRVWVGENEVELTRQEFDVLALLFNQLGHTVAWQELLQQVWRDDQPNKDNIGTLRSCIRRLRKKLGDDARHPRYIINRWGVGYQLGE
jgi:DNA-binding response OmpR family regulator